MIGIGSISEAMFKEQIGIETSVTGVTKIDDRIIDSVSKFASETEINKNAVLNRIDTTVNMTPEYLIDLQNKVLNYNIEVSLASGIARKTVGAVENLLRS